MANVNINVKFKANCVMSRTGRQKITITPQGCFPASRAQSGRLPALIVLIAFLTTAVRADDPGAEGTRNSFGFLYDHFKLTLEQGYRTEAAGPFYYSQQTGKDSVWAMPPFFSSYDYPAVESHEDDFLYPIFSSLHYGKERRWQFFQLLSFAGGQEPDGATTSRQTLFPLYFHQSSADTNLNYTALFPFYGTVKNRLYRDEIFVVLFPFYSETRKRDVVSDNYLYPIVNIRRGIGLHGWQVWPLVGREHKIPTLQTNGFGDVTVNAGHDYFFCLWPLYIQQDNGIGTDEAQTGRMRTSRSIGKFGQQEYLVPDKFRASIPLFVYSRSPQADMTTVLWPFFTWIDNRQKQYREWQMPWPVAIFARGEGKTTSRIFPLFQRSHNDVLESDFYLWPLYTYKRTHADPLDMRRTRVAYYLYSDKVETNTQTGHYKRRLDMWPFFTWHRDFNGNERLQVLAPIEPVVPDNRGIERNWSPLWSLWRAQHNPQTRASSHSLLWNLYRDEAAPGHKKVSLLFGLFQYQSDGGNRRTKLFYLTVLKAKAQTAAESAAPEH